MVVSCFLEWDMVIVVGLSPMLVRIKKKIKMSNVSGAPLNKTHSIWPKSLCVYSLIDQNLLQYPKVIKW